ncbi:MAG: gephyrin-like molybdotransferase Glp [Bacteroidia bacterium]
MVTVEEAKKILFENIQQTKTAELKITDALNHVLSGDVYSPIDLPSFDQSSMDGYAVNSGNDSERKEFEMVGEIKAGDDPTISLNAGQAMRIFTGAAVPSSADSIIIQERTEEKNGILFIQEKIKAGDCVRRKGTQIKKGELALKSFSVLNPASIGFMASLGFEQVKVFGIPGVSIIVTGNEIIPAGETLKNGKVFESNSFALIAALMQMNIEVKNNFQTGDNLENLKEKIKTCLIDSDIVLISGGISVGKYDFTLGAMKECGVETIFYKVAQKPGMPLFTGKTGNKIIFGLPGNPASVLVCFYEYVYPVLKQMQGFSSFSLPVVKLRTLKEIKKKKGKSSFIRGKLINDGVLELEQQDSNMLRSFAEADGLIYLDKEKEMIDRDEEVEVHLLPFLK